MRSEPARDRSMPTVCGRVCQLAARIPALVTLLVAALLLACGPAEPEPEPERSFSVERVVVGVGFDEAVLVEAGGGQEAPGAGAGAAPVQLAEVALTPAADIGRYAGVVRFSDLSGDAAEVRLDVAVGEAAGDEGASGEAGAAH